MRTLIGQPADIGEVRNLAIRQAIGRREEQEDCYAYRLRGLLSLADCVVIADGMGGHEGGKIASSLAVKTFINSLGKSRENTRSALLNATSAANRTLVKKMRSAPDELSEMGTTLVAAHYRAGRLHWASVGDSLLYLVQHGKISLLNELHSTGALLERQIASGDANPEEIKRLSAPNALYSYLGDSQIEEIDCRTHPRKLSSKDMLIVASDGILTLSKDELEHIVQSSKNVSRIADRLLEAIELKAKPRQDNVTIAVWRPHPFSRSHLIILALLAVLIAGAVALSHFKVEFDALDPVEKSIAESTNRTVK